MALNSYQSASSSASTSVATVEAEQADQVQSVTLNVAGQRISLRTDQNAEYLSDLALEVTEFVNSLRQSAPSVGLPQIMALAALQLADRARNAEAALAQGNGKIENHIKKLTSILNALEPHGN